MFGLGALLHLLVSATLLGRPAQGGICWAAMGRHGRCTELLDEKVSKEECCASNGVATAYSGDDLDAGTLFFWRVLGGGVPCQPCKESCSGVQCGAGKKCVVRQGQPKCVCHPRCHLKETTPRGPVCGTDGRTYRSLCKLRRRACRKNSASLTLAYHGACQRSCERLRCPTGKHCLLDQNLTPHCVRCAPRRCPPHRPVCGADRRTYPSACHLRQAACRQGKAIPVAYKGKCFPSATCRHVSCSAGQRCLTDRSNGHPRCVTCSASRCPEGAMAGLGSVTLCGSDNHTYPSWCHMMQHACAAGYVIDTQSAGTCLAEDQTELMANTVFEDPRTHS